MNAVRNPHPRVVVAVPHARLRDAVVAQLGSSAGLSIIATVSDLDSMVHTARADRADGVIVGTGLLRGDLGTSVRALTARLPGTRAVFIGTESSTQYAEALEAAGAAAYVCLLSSADVLAASVRRALRPEVVSS
jgi:DNA-binding NarL/FixJ family response regulator